jgi:uncharacterized membrane protein
MERSSRKVALTALIASSYSLMTIALGELSYSWIQIRISEALTPLPFLLHLPAVIGLTIGCITANLFSPVGLPDLVFGPLLTFIAAVLSWKLNFRRRIMACVYPVLVNAFGVSVYVSIFYGVAYMQSVLTIAFGEFIAAVLIGYPLISSIGKMRAHRAKH